MERGITPWVKNSGTFVDKKGRQQQQQRRFALEKNPAFLNGQRLLKKNNRTYFSSWQMCELCGVWCFCWSLLWGHQSTTRAFCPKIRKHHPRCHLAVCRPRKYHCSENLMETMFLPCFECCFLST